MHSAVEIKKRETSDTLIERRHGTSTIPFNILPPDLKRDDGEAFDVCSAYHDDVEEP